MEHQIHTLGIGMAAVALRGRKEAFIAQIDPVLEWWPSGREKYEAVRLLKARLHALHPYHFRPADLATERGADNESDLARYGYSFPEGTDAANGSDVVEATAENPKPFGTD